MMIEFLAVGGGGALGALLRFAVMLVIRNQNLPAWLATFGVNVLGSFLMGLAFALLSRKGMSESLRLLIMTGFLGGFTTFSAFSQDVFILVRQANFILAFTYVLASFMLSFFAFLTGYFLFQHVLFRS